MILRGNDNSNDRVSYPVNKKTVTFMFISQALILRFILNVERVSHVLSTIMGEELLSLHL